MRHKRLSLLLGALMLALPTTLATGCYPLPDEEFCEKYEAPPDDGGGEPDLELYDLLRRGSEFLENYTDVSEAVILLGNTGSGKSTTGQIIAANLSKLHAVEKGIDLIIIDEDNKIGSTTKSKTLFPELILLPAEDSSSGKPLPFYDYPGFSDNRGPVMDLAANFFMTEVIKKIDNVKMLFLTKEDNVEPGSRVFDDLAINAVKFVKNFDKFNQSVALVVTMVNGFLRGRCLEDETIIEEKVVLYLEGYITDQESELGKGKDDEFILKKIRFVQALLDTDAEGNYHKIWIVRSPIECGRLSDQDMYQHVRANLTELYERLEYKDVQAKGDFGFTLDGGTINKISEYSADVNRRIFQAVIQVAEGLEEEYFGGIREKVEKAGIENLDLSSLHQELKNLQERLAPVVRELKSMNPERFLSTLKSFWETVGFSLSRNFVNFMTWQETYLQFFDEAANGETQERRIWEWTDKILEFSEVHLEHHIKWVKFNLDLQSNLDTYDFQRQRPAHPGSKNISELLSFLLEHNAVNEDQVEPIFDILKETDLPFPGLLDELLKYGLEPSGLVTKCDAGSKSLTIQGNFLTVSRDLNNLQDKVKACGFPDFTIRAFAGHTIFFDEDLTLDQTDFVILAPNWYAHYHGTQQRRISLTQSATANSKEGEAEPGSDGNAGRGGDGCKGGPGAAGKSLFGMASKVDSDFTFSITTKSGAGGNGQKGGTGGLGPPTADAYRPHLDHNSRTDSKLCEGNWFGRACHFRSWGVQGKKGGKGGDGGIGGVVGVPGVLNLITFETSSDTELVKLTGEKGTDGDGGTGGTGGAPGRGWYYKYREIMSIRFDENSWMDPASHGREVLIPGDPGTRGASSRGCFDLTVPQPQTISEAEQILQFRLLFANEAHSLTEKFLDEIAKSPNTDAFVSLGALSNEALALNNLGKNSKRLPQLYSSFHSRLLSFIEKSNLNPEQKKAANMLSSTSLSSLMNLRPQRDSHMTTDISYSLDFTKLQVEALKSLSFTQAMTEVNTNLERMLNQTILDGAYLIQNFVLPSLHQAGEDIDVKLNLLLAQLKELINDERISDEERIEKLRKSTEQQGFLHFVTIFGVMRDIVPEIGKGDLEKALEELEAEFEGHPEKLDRLRVLITEAESLTLDLNEKRNDFKTEFIPVIEHLLRYFQEVFQALAVDGEVPSPDFGGISKDEVIPILRECKEALEAFSDASLSTTSLTNGFERLQDIAQLTTDLYTGLLTYLEVKELSRYVQAAELEPTAVTTPGVENLYKARVRENLIEFETGRAHNLFNQAVFPFAKFYTLPETLLASNSTLDSVRKVEYLKLQHESYKGLVINGQGDLMTLTEFSSDVKGSHPFFIWENEEHKPKIESLLSGQMAHLTADVTLQPGEKDAVKHRLIEINLKLASSTPPELIEEFEDIIDYFGVEMSHSGVAHTRFQGEYFVTTGSSLVIKYNFEKNSAGDRLGTNGNYEKFKAGDYQQSPFASWMVNLVKVTPTGKKEVRNDVDFANLENFLPYISLELVGSGTYVNVENAIIGAGGDMELDRFYENDQRLNRRFEF